MVHPAVACAEQATDDKLVSPDWAINIELCDIINMNPGQAKDALKIIKKRLGSKKPKIQLLALSVLDALIKNCGENVIQQIVEREILLEMVKIVKKKPDITVREQILILIDTWQEALGGKFPQFIQAYSALRDTGVEFPLREESSVTLFTPPQTQPIVVHLSNFEDVAIQASLQENVSSLSASDMQTAQELGDVLMEMLGALDPNNRESINQELILDLVEQCQGYQKRVLNLVNNTADESLLFQGLALNDNLQRVLRRHEEISKETTDSPPAKTESSAPPFIGMNHEEDESEDDFSQLAPRSQSRRSTPKPVQIQASTYVPPQPSSKKPFATDANVVDYLSGDSYKSDRPFAMTVPVQTQKNSVPADFTPSGSRLTASPPHNILKSSPPSIYDKQPIYDEPDPVARSSGPTPAAPWEPQTTVSLPPPPAKYNQRQQFFEQHGGSLNSSNGSGSSYDSLVGQTQNLTLNSTPKNGKSEDALFKDLVDFAKAKKTSSSSSTSKNKRSY